MREIPYPNAIHGRSNRNGSLSPTSFGLMGGAMQPQGHAQIVINLIDFEMNLQEAKVCGNIF